MKRAHNQMQLLLQAAAKPAAAEAAASQAASASGSGMARPWALAQQPHAGRWGAQTGVPRAWSSAKPRPGGAAAGAAAATKGAAAAGGGAAAGEAQSRSPFERWWAAFQSVPPVPKLLGVTGAIPFIALSPPVSKHLFWILPHDVIDNSAMFQVGYGISIVTFLGAVHWGLAMGSTAMASPLMRRAARESYLWSVVPSLSSFWLAAMEPAPASLLLSMMLPACYLVDRARSNYLPQWYMALRGPLTLAATFGMLLTASYYVHLESDRVAAAAAAAAAAAEQGGQQQQQQQQNGGKAP